jgi:hypothetical protein
MVVLGVIADTHVPDRRADLHPGALAVFRQAGVAAILHAGDISTPAVLQTLATLAPVHAVRGNRDWVALKDLPASLELEFAGVKLGLAHGHGRWWNYILDRTRYILFEGYRPERFQRRMLVAFPQAQVIVYGHTHRAYNQVVAGKLLFNPGVACCREIWDLPPSVGLLRLEAGQAKGEIIALE